MIRAEIFANQSTQEYIINNLVAAMPDFYYSVIPLVTGRGGDSYKLGTTTWPETNVSIIAYCEDSCEAKIKTVVDYAKEKFPDEGIKLFVLHDKN